MVNNNVFYRLARDSLKYNRSRTVSTIITATIVIVILCSVSIIFDSFEKITTLAKQEEYGYWNIGTYSSFDNIDLQYNYDKAGEIIELANSNSGHCIGMIDKSAMELCNIKIIDGIIPQDDQQIATTKDFLLANGYSDELGQIIGLSYVDSDGKFIEQEVVLCGILNDFNLNNSINIPTVIFKYDNSRQDSTRSMILFQNGQPKDKSRGYDILNDQITLSPIEEAGQRSINALIYIVTLIVAGIVIYGAAFASLKTKKQEFILLRGIGATKKQLKKIIKYEAGLIIIIAVLMGVVISFGLSYMLMLTVQMNRETVIFEFTGSSLIWRIITGIIIILIGIIQPLFKASKYALSGAFGNKEFKYFESRFKKLRRQSCLYLAFRELKTNKKIMIFLIIVLAVSMNRTTRIGYEYSQVKLADELLKNQDYTFKITDSSDNGISQEIIERLSTNSQELKTFQFENYQVDSYHDIGLYALNDGNLEFEKLTGSLPQHSNEIVLFNEKKPKEYWQDENDLFLSQYQIGDEIKLERFDSESTIVVKIVGIIDTTKNLQDNHEISAFVNNEFFSIYEPAKVNKIQYVTAKANNYRNYIKLQEQISNLSNQSMYIQAIDDHLIVQESYDQIKNEFIESLFFVLSILFASFFLFYYINRITLINNCHELGILKSLGATNWQLYKIQINKCLIISFFAIILSQWSLVYYLYDVTGSFASVIEQSPMIIICLVLIVIIGVFVVILPLRCYTKVDILELTGRFTD